MNNNWYNTTNQWYVFTDLPEGKKHFYAKVYSSTGATDVDQVDAWIDLETPSLEIISNQEGKNISSHFISIKISLHDSNCLARDMQYRTDGEEWCNISSSRTSVDLSLNDGTHTIDLKGIDIVGKINQTSVTFTVDTNFPLIDFFTNNKSFFKNKNVTIKWNSTDTTTGIQTLSIRKDKKNWRNLSSSSNNYTFSFTEGNHTISLYSKDWASNSQNKTLKVTVDVTSPQLLVTNPEKEEDPYWSKSSVEFTYATNDTYFTNTSLYVNGSLNDTYTSLGLKKLSKELKEGSYGIHFVAKDEAGNKNVSRNITLFVDTTTPKVDVNVPTYVNSREITVQWEYTDNFRINNSQIIDEGGNETNVQLTGNKTFVLQEGVHFISFKATDMVSHETIVKKSVTIDLTTPKVSIIYPSYGKWFNTTTIELQWNGSDKYLSHYEVRLNEEAWIEIGTRESKTFLDLSEGEQIFSVKAFDKAGNVKKDANLVNIDEKKPKVEIKSPSEPVKLQNFSLTWEASDSVDIKKLEVYVNGSLYETYYNSSKVEHTFKNFPLGFWTIEVMVFDYVNHTDIDSVNVEMRKMSISISNLPPHYYTQEEKIVINWTEKGQGLDRVELFLNSRKRSTLPWERRSYTLQLGKNATNGNYSITIRLYDRYENSVADSSIITLDRKDPKINLLNSNHSFTKEKIRITWNGTDINRTEIFLNNSLSARVNATTTSFTIKLLRGKNNLLLKVKDKAGNTATSSPLIVYSDVIPPNLSIFKPQNNTKIEGREPVVVKWNVTDNYYVEKVTIFIDRTFSHNYTSHSLHKISELKIGKHTIKIVVLDKAGNKRTKHIMFTFTKVTEKSNTLTLLNTLTIIVLSTIGIILTIKGLLNLRRTG